MATTPANGPDPADFLGSLEARIMDVVWDRGSSTVNDVLDQLNADARRELAYNTVMSVLARLAEKGHLTRTRRGRAFVYTATHDRDGFLRERAATDAQTVIDDFGTIGVAGFVDTVKSDPALLDELQRLLDDA